MCPYFYIRRNSAQPVVHGAPVNYTTPLMLKEQKSTNCVIFISLSVHLDLTKGDNQQAGHTTNLKTFSVEHHHQINLFGLTTMSLDLPVPRHLSLTTPLGLNTSPPHAHHNLSLTHAHHNFSPLRYHHYPSSRLTTTSFRPTTSP